MSRSTKDRAINADQVAKLETLIIESGTTKGMLLKFLHAESLEQIPAERFEDVVHALEWKKRGGNLTPAEVESWVLNGGLESIIQKLYADFDSALSLLHSMEELRDAAFLEEVAAMNPDGSYPYPDRDRLPRTIWEAIDQVGAKLEELNSDRHYRDHKDPELRVAYLRYVERAVTFMKLVLSISRNPSTAIDAAFQAGQALDLLHAADLMAQTAQRRAHDRIQKQQRLSDELREKVAALNSELTEAFPKKTPRFREIAERLDMNSNTVRWILDPPKKRK